MLGEATVNGNVDHDVIHVGKTEGQYDAVTLVVADSDLEMLDMNIVFGNGDRWSPKVTHYFREGSRTRAINLPAPSAKYVGKGRFIKDVELTYRNLPGGGRARVELWGKPHAGGVGGNEPPPRPPGGGAPPPPPPPPVAEESWDKTGWTMLGAQDVAGRRDKDVFPVGRARGFFDRIRLVVKDSDLEMNDVVVTFESGEKFSPKTKQTFKEGQRSRAIDLPGKNRYIKDVTVLYGNLPGSGRAHVEVWAKNVAPGKEGKDGK